MKNKSTQSAPTITRTGFLTTTKRLATVAILFLCLTTQAWGDGVVLFHVQDGVRYKLYNNPQLVAVVSDVSSSEHTNSSLSGHVVIPAKVNNGDVIIPVLGIDLYGLRDAVNLNSIILSEGLRSIGYHAFARNNNLKYISMPSTMQTLDWKILDADNTIEVIQVNRDVPPSLHELMKSGYPLVGSGRALFYSKIVVPPGRVAAYRADPNWGQFLNIEEVALTAPEQLSFGRTEGGISCKIPVSSNGGWTFSLRGINGQDSTWCEIIDSDNFGYRNDSLTVRAKTNNTNVGATMRVARIELKSGSLTRYVNVYQGGPDSMSVNTSSVVFDASASSQTVSVTSNVSWTTSNINYLNGAGSWLTITPSGNNADGTITITGAINISAAQNTTGSPRTARFTISGVTGTSVAPITIEVTQRTPDFIVNGIKYTVTSQTTVSVVRNDATYYPGNITIPSTVTNAQGITYTVTGIADNGCKDCLNLTSVTLPNTITSIGDNAFSGCNKLTSINLPDGLTSIGYNAFAYCYKLESINIPGSVGWISNYAFKYCKSMTTLIINHGVETIGAGAFENCDSLVFVSIPSSVTEIRDISFFAFHPAGSFPVTEFEVAWDNPLNIDDGPFYTANGSTPKSSYRLLVPPWRVDEYGRAPEWKDFGQIVGTTLTPSPTALSCGYTGGVITQPVNITASGYWTVSIPPDAGWLTANARSGLKNNTLTFTAAPNPGTKREAMVTIYSGGVTRTVLVEQSRLEFMVDGIRYALLAPNSVGVIQKTPAYSGDITIPPTVSYEGTTYAVIGIAEEAFAFCTGLTSITLPEGMTMIAPHAFEGCSGLVSATIPGSVNLIDAYAFLSCASLTSVNLTNNNNIWIGEGAFEACNSLEYVYLPDSIYMIEKSAFKLQRGADVPFPALTVELAQTIQPILTYISREAFGSDTLRYRLIVPQGTLAYYRGEYLWGDFGEIIEKGSLSLGARRLFFDAIEPPDTTISITSGGDWTFSIVPAEADWWLTATAISRNLLNVGAAVNPGDYREAHIYINNGYETDSIYAGQAANPEIVSPVESLSFDARPGEDVNVAIASYYDWVVSADADWLTATKLSDSFTVTATTNSGGERTADIVVNNGYSTLTIPVTQAAGSTLDVTTSSMFLAVTPAFEEIVRVTSYVDWDVSVVPSEASSWLTVTVTQMSSEADDNIGTFAVSAATNTGEERTAAIIVDNGTFTHTISVVQEGIYIMYNDVRYARIHPEDPSNHDIAVVNKSPLQYSGYLDIPSEVPYNDETFNVVRIGNGAFDNSVDLTSVSIPTSVTAIEDGAFYRCTGIASITIPASVASIGAGAFAYCSSFRLIEVGWDSPLGDVDNIFGDDFFDFGNCTLVVPQDSKPLYESADVWREFGTITYKAYPDNISFGGQTNLSATVAVTTHLPWTVSKNVDWLTVSTVTGSGSGSIVVTAAPNNVVVPREGIVTLHNQTPNGTNDVTIITVSQGVGTASIDASPASLTFGATDSKVDTVFVASNTTWTISESADWIKLNSAGNPGSNRFTVSVAPNVGNSARNGHVVVSGTGYGAGATDTVYITQGGSAPYIYLAPATGFEIDAADGSARSVNVTSNIDNWTIAASDNWINPATASGSLNSSFTFTLSTNNGVAREGAITVSGAGASESITVKQKATAIIEADQESLSFAAASQPLTETVTVTAYADWIATVPAEHSSWLRITPPQIDGSGTFAGSFTVTAFPNLGAERSTEIIISNGITTTTIPVTQSPGPLNTP